MKHLMSFLLNIGSAFFIKDIYRTHVCRLIFFIAVATSLSYTQGVAQCLLQKPFYTVSPDGICPGATATVTTTVSAGAVARWYTTIVGGTPFYEGTSYTMTVDTLTYLYIETYNGSCSSSRAMVELKVQRPLTPLVRVAGILAGEGKVVLRASLEGATSGMPGDAGGDAIRWYASVSSTVPVAEGFEFVTPSITAPTTYYVRAVNTVGGCQSRGNGPFQVPYPLVPVNRVITEDVRVAGVTMPLDLATLPVSQKKVSLSQLDGFTRPIQQVVRQVSPSGKDVVQPVEYDAFGRSSRQYLPYTATTATGVDILYKANQPVFYNNTADAIADDAMPYASSAFEASPLGRVLEQGNVGADFQPGTGHTQRLAYSYNIASEVRKFAPDGSSTGFYPTNTLKMLTATDPNGNKTIAYEDSQGRTILTKQQLDKTIQGVSTPYLETYYIYDELSRVRYVISPKGVAAMKSSSWAFTEAVKTQYVFESVYDYRSRLVEKRTPGQASTYYVYDKLNRLVLVQDGLLRAQNKWIFVKYDRKERPVLQGLYLNATNVTRASVQALVDALYTSGNATYSENSYFESRGTVLHGYTNVSFPKVNADNSAVEVLGVNYYESYDFDYNGVRDFKHDSLSFSGQATTSDWRAYGFPTGSKQLVLGTSTWLYSYAFYDKYGRVVQSRSNNHLNPSAIDNVSTAVYDFEGKLLAAKTYHSAGAGKQTTVVNRYEYDFTGRLLRVYQNNNGASSDQLLVEYTYNELGQVIDKKFHQVSGSTFLQSVDYRYSIQGWLKTINNPTLQVNTQNNDDTDDYFGMELIYNTQEPNLGNSLRYDGNIAAVVWKGLGAPSGNVSRRAYKFTYDKANRMETATWQRYDLGRWNTEVGSLNEQLSYDQNGNILTLLRNERKYDPANPSVRTSETMDNLTYTYETQQGNRLLKVEDASGNLAGFKNGANVATEYTYDVNGNTLTDQNKGISSVVYNVLGKPDQVIFSDGRKLVYVYDAGGTKLTMKTYQGTTLQTTTDYVGSFVYENGALQFFSSPEGRVVKNGSTLDYQYAIADHQGNTRVVFTSATPTPAATNADFEAATNTAFENYINRSSLEIFDHTDTGPTATYSQLLNGGMNGQVGLAKTLKVYPGDKVKIDAYAKYWNIGENTSNVSAFATMLTSAFGVSGASTGDALKAYNTLSSYGGLVAAGTAHGSAAGDPKGFVTILLFDKDFNFLDAAWDQLDDLYAQGTNIAVKNAFDHLLQEVTVKEEGYAYIYLSNESPTLVDIYFDDVTVTHTKTRVIQYNEYYPFGLQTASSWTRENTIGNRFLYNQGSELNAQSGWYETMFRGYDPGLGRFMQVDPLAVAFADVSPYNYGLNNPVLWNDPNGDRPVRVSTNGDYSNWLMPDGSLEPVRNPYSIMSEFTNGLDMSMTNHWATPFRSVGMNFAMMSSSEFQSYYGAGLSTDEGTWTLAQSMSGAPSEAQLQQAAHFMGVQLAGISGNSAWFSMVYEPARYAGGLEAENQVAIGTYGLVEVELGGQGIPGPGADLIRRYEQNEIMGWGYIFAGQVLIENGAAGKYVTKLRNGLLEAPMFNPGRNGRLVNNILNFTVQTVKTVKDFAPKNKLLDVYFSAAGLSLGIEGEMMLYENSSTLAPKILEINPRWYNDNIAPIPSHYSFSGGGSSNDW